MKFRLSATSPNQKPAARERAMVTVRPTALTRLPIYLLEQAAALGVDRRILMEKSGIHPQDLRDPDGRVPSIKVWWLWQELIQRVPDPALGITMGQTLRDPLRFGLVGYTMSNSRTVGEALDRLARYSRIVAETIGIAVEAQNDRACVSLVTDPQFELLRHPIDNRLASILATARGLSGRPLTPLMVELPYPRLKNLSEHRRFFQAPLHFRAPRAALHLRKEDLTLPIVHADDTLVGYLDRLATQQLKELGAGTMTERVGKMLWSELTGGIPSLNRIASRLGVSTRSLQRQLQDEGNPFRSLLDEFRREMAVRLGRLRSLSVHEIAYLLGYADSSSFHRAFRRWYRASPRALRRRDGSRSRPSIAQHSPA
jgi:AraC-like DNA-binding protein